MSRTYIACSWDECGHLDEHEKEELFKALPPHQRDARSKGIPALGSGAIYPIPESEVVVRAFTIPHHYKHVYGLDVGWNNTAAAFFAIDPDSGIKYLVGEYKRGQAEPSIHAAAIHQRARGKDKPGVIDPAARGRSQADGTQLLQLYRQLGLNVCPADNSVESGIYEVWQALSLGQFKIFDTCTEFLAEYRLYRRDEKGKVVKDCDHLQDCVRYVFNSGINLAAYDIKGGGKEADPYKVGRFKQLGSWMGV